MLIFFCYYVISCLKITALMLCISCSEVNSVGNWKLLIYEIVRVPYIKLRTHCLERLSLLFQKFIRIYIWVIKLEIENKIEVKIKFNNLPCSSLKIIYLCDIKHAFEKLFQIFKFPYFFESFNQQTILKISAWISPALISWFY